jgi:hypothetical protein
MFLDADMILAPEVVTSCLRYNNIALHIPEIILGKNYWSQVHRFERSFYDGTVIDGARFFKKEIFVQVNGFDPTMSGPEDWDIDKKIKAIGEIGLLPISKNRNKISNQFIRDKGIKDEYENVIFHNESEFNLKPYLNKKGYYAQSFDTYINKWGKNDPGWANKKTFAHPTWLWRICGKRQMEKIIKSGRVGNVFWLPTISSYMA